MRRAAKAGHHPTRALRAARLALPLLLASLGCGSQRSGPSSSAPVASMLATPPSIVVVTIDTLRADHLHCYGYHRETSPNIDAVAAEGALFERAFAAMATTLPSHVSLFSGVYPHHHGITENRFRRDPFAAEGGLRSVAQLLAAEGYRTAAFVSAAPVKRVSGVGAGFELFDEPTGYEKKGDATTDKALAWLEEGPAEPFLLWVHLWDPHEPNRPGPRWETRFPDDEGLERVIDERGIDPDRLAESFAPPALRRFLAPGTGRRDDEVPVVDREAVRGMLNRYDADVATADREVGRLVEALRSRDILDRAILVLTGDHGQSLGQHDWLPHGRVTNDNLHVPLILRFPPGVIEPPLRISGVVSLVDVMPTVLSRFESEAGRRFLDQAEGQDLLAGAPLRGWALGQRTSRHRPGWEPGDVYALISDRFKLVRHGGGDDELYDLATDPGESTDVSAEHAKVKAELRRTLATALRRRPPAVPVEEEADGETLPPDEHLEALRSLGYVDD